MDGEAQEYRKRAAECREQAKTARTGWERQQLSELAVLWDELAKHREKISETQDKLKEFRKSNGNG